MLQVTQIIDPCSHDVICRPRSFASSTSVAGRTTSDMVPDSEKLGIAWVLGLTCMDFGYIYIYMDICIYLYCLTSYSCVCLHTDTQTHRCIHAQRPSRTDRPAHSQTKSQSLIALIIFHIIHFIALNCIGSALTHITWHHSHCIALH